MDVYLEYDQPSDYLLDLRATLKLGDPLFLPVGQWKLDFNRGRIDFSDRLQMN